MRKRQARLTLIGEFDDLNDFTGSLSWREDTHSKRSSESEWVQAYSYPDILMKFIKKSSKENFDLQIEIVHDPNSAKQAWEN